MKYYIVKSHQKYVYLVTNESATYKAWIICEQIVWGYFRK